MKAEISLLIMNLVCTDPQMTFRDFYSRYFVPRSDTGVFRWGYQGETFDTAFRRQMDAFADYGEYRIALATQCGRKP